MGSSKDWPVSEWLRNQERQDREDLAHGITPPVEEETMIARRLELARERRERLPQFLARDFERRVESTFVEELERRDDERRRA